ncbi:MAG: amino acid adenylation domain-containing protein [Acidobacteriota bacterium]|nr:amino acid adenylation domain-containing protein [Acidobacteriota bacterium]
MKITTSPPELLHQMIDQAALRSPEAPAIRCDGATLSYEELARQANGMARVLIDAGLQRGDRVAVLLGKGFNVPVAFYGVFAAGGTLVPIDPKSPVEQVVRIVRATGATHLVSQPEKREFVRGALAACPDVKYAVGIDLIDETPVRSCSWDTVAGEATDRPPAVSVIDLDPSYILHTSGSTGTPKLILHTHRSAMSFVEWAVAEYALTSDDRLSNHSSHHTCFATFDYYAAARAGAATVLLTPAALIMPGSLAALVERERVSVWYSVPTALVQLSLRGNLEARDLSSIRWVLFAGETFPEKHLRRIMRQLPDARFSHVYGSTEINVCAYYHVPESLDLSAPLPIGKACSNARTQVVDAELQPVADGEVGELLVRGATVMSGYWGDPDRNRQVLFRQQTDGELEEVYFRTGDQVRIRDDGNLTFVARADLQIKVRGYRVELEEVESALLSLDMVEEAAAFAVPDGEGSSAIRAAVVVGGDDPLGQRDVLAGLAKILPLHAVPSEISILDSLPRTPTGKVDRNALRTQLTQQEAGDVV